MIQNVNTFVLKGRGGATLEDIVREEAAALNENFKEVVESNGEQMMYEHFNVFNSQIITFPQTLWTI